MIFKWTYFEKKNPLQKQIVSSSILDFKFLRFLFHSFEKDEILKMGHWIKAIPQILYRFSCNRCQAHDWIIKFKSLMKFRICVQWFIGDERQSNCQKFMPVISLSSFQSNIRILNSIVANRNVIMLFSLH